MKAILIPTKAGSYKVRRYGKQGQTITVPALAGKQVGERLRAYLTTAGSVDVPEGTLLYRPEDVGPKI